jgi:hypothetical protein
MPNSTLDFAISISGIGVNSILFAIVLYPKSLLNCSASFYGSSYTFFSIRDETTLRISDYEVDIDFDYLWLA